jgi:hypothetical protein
MQNHLNFKIKIAEILYKISVVSQYYLKELDHFRRHFWPKFIAVNN